MNLAKEQLVVVATGRRSGCDYNRVEKGDVCGDGTVLYFDGGSGYMNPHL